MRFRPARARRVLVVLVAGVALSAASCSSDDGSSTATTTAAAPATEGQGVTAAPDGLPEFYAVPDPLPEGDPGDLLKAEQVEVPDVAGTVWRVMYLSESVLGEPIAVTGLVVAPVGDAPDGGRPVVTWAHGTTGIADQCAPSLDPTSLAPLAGPLLEQGYVVTATDYEGMGTPGRHPYIVGESEGRGTLDVVTAAGQIDGLTLSDAFAVWGHSQGGHGALYAGHLAPERVPELDLVGVVAGAPPSQLLLINQALQASPFKYYIGMVAAGFNAAYGDDGAPLEDVLTPEGVAWIDQVDEMCARDLAVASADVDFAALQKADPSTVPGWSDLLEENDPGLWTEPIEAPLLMIHGGDDEQIPLASSALLFDQLCDIGQVEQRWVYPEQSHAGVIAPSLDDMLTWLDHRFAGEPAPDPMQPQGPPVPEVQSCPAG